MLQSDGPAPYAPISAVMKVIRRHRDVGLSVIDAPTLMRMSISESLAPRTLQSLRLLELVDDEGRPTHVFELLRKAPSAEFQNALGELIRRVYAPVFQVVDPTAADAKSIEDAFRHFRPAGQRGRMVTLFTGLLEEAGLVSEAPRKKPGPAAIKSRSRTHGQRAGVQEFGGVKTASDTVAVQRSASEAGDEYKIDLLSGGSVQVRVDVNLFMLSTQDREFVIDLVDRLLGYATATGANDKEVEV